ncbi:pyridoxamine 5'-phosphate oxidase family protein [Cellulomonas sp. ICMP 17802]|uniref:pyridoxamine 5'-phosphate oxidase family protein n=1 Tax=Cellulomonas sp. ICMP 17802 TaxID=3239199 RepID=UPI00351BC727
MGHESGPERRPTTEDVWRAIERASFAVLSHLTPEGEPRSSGVVYVATGGRMYVAVAPDAWKARHLAADGRLAVTVPVRRGGLLSLLFPIPPATVSFHATAVVHPAGELPDEPKQLASLVPAERRAECRLIEIVPVGQFLTYGIGVSLNDLRSPALARARVPVEALHAAS